MQPEEAEQHPERADPAFRAACRAKLFLGYTSNLVSAGVREHIRYLVQVRSGPGGGEGGGGRPGGGGRAAARCSAAAAARLEVWGAGGRPAPVCSTRASPRASGTCRAHRPRRSSGRAALPTRHACTGPADADPACTGPADADPACPACPARPSAPHGGRDCDHSGRGGGGLHQGGWALPCIVAG